MTSSAGCPNVRSAARLKASTVPISSITTIASTAASKSARSSALAIIASRCSRRSVIRIIRIGLRTSSDRRRRERRGKMSGYRTSSTSMTADLAHILVVLDAGAKQQPALERGAWLAERTGAALELFVCDYDQDLAASPHFDPGALECARRHLLAAHRRTLEAHAKRLAARGIHARV